MRPLHDIRQGLRTFATTYYLSPGRLNLVQVGNADVFVDYCHNAAGMKELGAFVDRYAAQKQGQADLGRTSRIGMIGAAGDRRDDDMRELGAVAAQHFDVIVVREDERLRGRKPGETAALVAEGARAAIADGARCRQVEIVLDELEATRHVLARTNPGDLVVMCVDQHALVVAELEERTKHAQAGARIGAPAAATSDPDLDPSTLTETAEAEGDEAEGEALGAVPTEAQPERPTTPPSDPSSGHSPDARSVHSTTDRTRRVPTSAHAVTSGSGHSTAVDASVGCRGPARRRRPAARGGRPACRRRSSPRASRG